MANSETPVLEMDYDAIFNDDGSITEPNGVIIVPPICEDEQGT